MKLNELLFLTGKWSGHGTAGYPTINDTGYNEELVFEYDQSKDVIFYVQRTKFSDPAKSGLTLHLESGFIRQNEDGSIELSNSQNNGRVEVLILKEIINDSGKTNALFTSKLFGNDPRMVSAVREYILNGDVLCYEMKMATVKNKELKTHTRAELNREF